MTWTQLQACLTNFSRLPSAQQALFIESANASETLQGLVHTYAAMDQRIPLRLLQAAEGIQEVLQGELSHLQPSWTRWTSTNKQQGLGLVLSSSVGTTPWFVLPHGVQPIAIAIAPEQTADVFRLPGGESLSYVQTKAIRVPEGTTLEWGAIAAFMKALMTRFSPAPLRFFRHDAKASDLILTEAQELPVAALKLGLTFVLGEDVGFNKAPSAFISILTLPDPALTTEDLFAAAEESVVRARPKRIPRLSLLDPRLVEFQSGLQEAFGPYRRLKEPSYFFEALAGLATLKGILPRTILSFLQRHLGQPVFRQSLLYLTLQNHLGFISNESRDKILEQAARWQDELGERYDGFDLIEKSLRAQIPHFMGSEPRSPEYEIAVAASLLRRPEVISVSPIAVRKQGTTPDYRVRVRGVNGSETSFFVEAKILQPTPQDLTTTTRHKFIKALRETRLQFRGYPEGRSTAGNTAFIAVVDERNELDMDRAQEVYRRWAEGRIERIHIDFYGPGFIKQSELDVAREIPGTR